MRSTLLRPLAILPLFLAACGGDDPTDSPPVLAGSYVATQFLVTPTGQAAINVLTSGGSLVITIATSGATSGSLVVPASLTGGQSETIAMSGAAVRSGNTVTFQQTADSFVRDLT
jgi:hypothetical protein